MYTFCTWQHIYVDLQNPVCLRPQSNYNPNSLTPELGTDPVLPSPPPSSTMIIDLVLFDDDYLVSEETRGPFDYALWTLYPFQQVVVSTDSLNYHLTHVTGVNTD